MKKPLLIGIALVITAGGAFVAIKSSSEENKTAYHTPTPQEVNLEKDADTPVTTEEVTIDTVLSDVGEIVEWEGEVYSRGTILWNTKDGELKLEGKGYLFGERLGSNEMELQDKYDKLKVYLIDFGFKYDRYNVGSSGPGSERIILKLQNIGCELYIRDDIRKDSKDMGLLCAELPDDVIDLVPEPMSEKRARSIAETSDCVKDGSLKDTAFYNENTKTWWIDLDIEKPGCSPACVVYENESVEINWRCTGLIED